VPEAISIAALATAFAAGLLSILSPCVLPLMPAYLSLISGLSVEEMRGGAGGGLDGGAGEGVDPAVRRRVFGACLGFVAGFSAVFVVLGASASALGRGLQGLRGEIGGLEISLVQVAGVVLVVMGLHLLGVLRIPLLNREARFLGAGTRRGALGTFAFGAAFAFGWSPCIGPVLGGILTLAAGRETVGEGVVLLSVYSAGLAVPFLLAGWSVGHFFRGLGRMRPHLRKVELAAGGLLVATGLVVAFRGLAFGATHFAFLAEWVARAEETLL